jgi:hypothetical protein
MKRLTWGRMALELALQRTNPLWVLVAALWLGSCALWLLVLPQERELLAGQTQQLNSLRLQHSQAPTEMQVPDATGPAQEQELQAVLGQIKSTEDYVGSLLSLAKSLGMTAQSGEYKLGCDAKLRLCRYRIRLPLMGSYGQLKFFVEQSLQTLPMASLDEFSLRRDTIGTTDLEASLVFTVYLAYPDNAEVLTQDAAP